MNAATSPLQRRRIALGLTQEEVAERAGIDRSHLSRLETGAADPHLRTAAALAAVLDSAVAELFLLDPDWQEAA